MPIHINDDGQESENYACDGGCGSWGGPNDYGRYCGNLTYSCGYTNGQLCGYKATGCSKSNGQVMSYDVETITYYMDTEGEYQLGDVTTQNIVPNTTIDYSTYPVKTGFTFAGVATCDSLQADSSKNFTAGTKNVTINKNMTVKLFYSRNKYTLDLNAVLDGDYIWGLPDGVTANIKINGNTDVQDTNDYCKSIYYESTYEVELKTTTGYTYNGVDTDKHGQLINPVSSLTGKMGTGKIYIAPSFTSKMIAITLNRSQFGNTGTGSIYLKYGDAYYSDVAGKNKITKITIPSKNGYTFKGYLDGNNTVIDKNGNILADKLAFSKDTILYANATYNSGNPSYEEHYKTPADVDYGGTTIWDVNASADEQFFIAPLKGYYQLDLYGAQGGNVSGYSNVGGYGGYVGGEIFLKKGEKIYYGVYPQGTGTRGYRTQGGTGSIIYTYDESKKESGTTSKLRQNGQVYRVDYSGSGFTNTNVNWDIAGAKLMNLYITGNRAVAYYVMTSQTSTNFIPANVSVSSQTVTPISIISIAGGGGAAVPYSNGGAGGTNAGQVSSYTQSVTTASYGGGGGGGASLGSYGYAVLHQHTGSCWGVVGYHQESVNASCNGGSGCSHSSWTSSPVGSCGCGSPHGHCSGFCSYCGGHWGYCGGNHSETVADYGWACGKTPGVTVDSGVSSTGGANSFNTNKLQGISSLSGQKSGDGHLKITMKKIPVSMITLDKNFGQWTGNKGTDKLWYYIDDNKYYDDSKITHPLSPAKITIPSKKGWTFEGYWTKENGKGNQFVDRDGNILPASTVDNITLYAFWVDETNPEEITLKFKKADGSEYTPSTWTKQTIYSTIVAKDYGTGLFYKYKVQDMPAGGNQYTSNVAGFRWEYGYLAFNDDISYSYSDKIQNKAKYVWTSDSGYTTLQQHNDSPETLLDNNIAKYRVLSEKSGWYIVKGWVKDDAINSGFYKEPMFSPEKNHVSSYPAAQASYCELKIDKMNPQIDRIDYWTSSDTAYHTVLTPNDVYENTKTKNAPKAKIVVTASDKHSGVNWFYMSGSNAAPSTLIDPLAKGINPTNKTQSGYSWQTSDTFYVTKTGWYYFWVMDEVGNVSSVQKKYIDLTAPTMTDVYTLSTHKYRLTYAEGYSEDYDVKRIQQSNDKIYYYPWVDGNFRLHFTAVDDKGTTATNSPGVGIYRMAVHKGKTVNDPVVHEVKWNTGDYTSQREIDYVVKATENQGTQYWTVQVWDRNGNTSYITVATRIDYTAPMISDTSEIYHPQIEDIKLSQIENFINNADNFKTTYKIVTLDYKADADTDDTSGMETSYIDVIDTSDSRIHKIYVLDETSVTDEKELTKNTWEGSRIKTAYLGSHNLYTDFPATTNLGRFVLAADIAGNLNNNGTQVNLWKYILPSNGSQKNTDPYGFEKEGPYDPYDPNSPTHVPSTPDKPGSDAGFNGGNGGSALPTDDPKDRDDDKKNPYDNDSDGGKDYTEDGNGGHGKGDGDKLPDGNGLPDIIDGYPPVEPTIPEESNTSQNFSIMTYIVNDESTHYNVSGDTGNVYFQLGEKGHVIVYTIGYVQKIQLDFLSMGKESGREIDAGLLSSQYNMGTASGTHTRYLNYKTGQKLGPIPDDENGVYFATKYDLGNLWESNGTAILIPPYYEMQDDTSKQPNADGSYPKRWELHYYKAIGHKTNVETGEQQQEFDKNSYIIWDTHETDVHYRVTHEP